MQGESMVCRAWRDDITLVFMINVDRTRSHLAHMCSRWLYIHKSLIWVSAYAAGNASWVCFQDELSNAGRGESKSGTPKSASTSDAASVEAEGLNGNLDSSSAKPDSSKNIGVQDAVASETPSSGDS